MRSFQKCHGEILKKGRKKLLILCLISLYALTSCQRMARQITKEEASSIAKPYFFEIWNKKVTIDDVAYRPFGERMYLNCIIVSDGEQTYELMLDKRNRPLADNVVVQTTLQHLEGKAEQWSARNIDEGYTSCNFLSRFSYEKSQYILACTLHRNTLLREDDMERTWQQMVDLCGYRVEEMTILIDTPDFLLPRADADEGSYAIQLAGMFFDTSMEKELFEKQYHKLADEIFWDEQTFDESITALTKAGYDNVFFYISKWINGKTLQIVLHCESDMPMDEDAIQMLKAMGDECFRIRDKNIQYIMEYDMPIL